MLGKDTEAALNAYAEDVVKFAKIGLGDRNRRRTYPSGRTVRGAIESSGALRNSIDYKLKISKNSIQLNVLALDYWEVVNDGRKAAYIPLAPLMKWIKQKPVKMRDENGKFVAMNDTKRKSLAVAISKSAKHNPRKGTFFMTKAIADATKKHEDKLTQAIFRDIDDAVTFTLNNIQSNGNNSNRIS